MIYKNRKLELLQLATKYWRKPEFAEDWIALYLTLDEEETKFYDDCIKGLCLKHGESYPLGIKDNIKEQNMYLLTFTLDPKKFPEVDNDLISAVQTYLEDQSKRKLGFTRYEYAMELHENGRPHWHVAVQCSGILKKSAFKYYTSKYGTMDISRTRGKSFNTILDYISKDTIITRVF